MFPLASLLDGAEPARLAENTASAEAETIVVLDANAVRNLGIRTVETSAAAFDKTAFVLGRIEARPESVAVVSSRIAGRVEGLSAFPGDTVSKGETVIHVESRQLGSPPPVVALTAPLDGTVTQLDARLGEPVEPDRTLMQITDLTTVYAVAQVPEYLAGRLEKGAAASIRIPALGEGLLEATLLRFGTTADAAAGTVDAVFLLQNREGKILPGMRAEFSILLQRRADVVAVPRLAVQGKGTERFVFVKHFDIPNAFIKTPVVVGETNDRLTEIVSGLFPADEVVADGAYALSFAGGGSMSLKEALDAAHGHEHNEDGSEKTSASGGSTDHDHAAEGGHGHEDGEDHEDALLWQILCGTLFVALLAALWRRGPPPSEESAATAADGDNRQSSATVPAYVCEPAKDGMSAPQNAQNGGEASGIPAAALPENTSATSRNSSKKGNADA